jgi:small GTP-binding protein
MLFHKICMVGAFGVGKTSLVRRFVSSIYDDRYLTTVGVKIDRKELRAAGQDVTLIVWDIAGEDEITRLSMRHLRGLSGYFLVADGCRRETLGTAIRLRGEIDAAYPDSKNLLLLNKVDLRGEWELTESDRGALRTPHWDVLETSAKSGEGVELAFERLAIRLLS